MRTSSSLFSPGTEKHVCSGGPQRDDHGGSEQQWKIMMAREVYTTSDYRVSALKVQDDDNNRILLYFPPGNLVMLLLLPRLDI